MIVNPISKETAIELMYWRNASREGLRTGWTTRPQQEEFYEYNFDDMEKKPYKYWEFLETVKQDDQEGVAALAAGGFVSDTAPGEIALIVHPKMRGKGFGSRCVEWILHEGFANLGFDMIWGEVYSCGAVSFWQKFIDKYEAKIERKLKTKYWNFAEHDSTFFTFDRGEYEQKRKKRPIRVLDDSGRDNSIDKLVSPDTRDGALRSSST